MTVKGEANPDRFPARSAAARVTRGAIVAAAAELFAQQGYSATTIQQVAARAGVGRATVFTSVPGGKPELLRLARDQALAGDDEPVPVPQRSWFIETMAERDGQRLLRRQAGNYRRMLQRAAVLELELQAAAPTHPELTELAAEARRQRAMGARLVVRHLAARPPGLRPELTEKKAADALYALSSANVWALLVIDRGWPPDTFEEWLGDQLVAALLPFGPPGTRRR